MGGVSVESGDGAAAFVTKDGEGLSHIDLIVKGIHCPKCISDIEGSLHAKDGVRNARVNFSTSRLHVAWDASRIGSTDIVKTITDLGFGATPIDAAGERTPDQEEARRLLIALAVAGFATANIMLLSISVWAGFEMGEATRSLLHWISGLIALPAVAFSGRPFFFSAWRSLRASRVNMDVPISLAVILACVLSVFEARAGGVHTYFDAAVMLLFFLLIGRYLDLRMRVRARSAANDLMALQKMAAQVIAPDGRTSTVPAAAVHPGDLMLVAQGERVPVDGVVESGRTELDVSLLTGETVPAAAEQGTAVFAGAINLGAPIRVRAEKTRETSLLAEIARLMEIAEQGRARFVRLADKAASVYVPVVHTLAAATFMGWWLLGTGGWIPAATNAIAVLIITCPCALGLAVPVVQVVATGYLFRRGVLTKSSDGLERLAEVDAVVLDKTGTLTRGHPELITRDGVAEDDLALAATLARASRHPLSRALVRAAGDGPAAKDVTETPGFGLAWASPEGEVRLGSRAWCGIEEGAGGTGPELWLRHGDGRTVHFAFEDALRTDAAETVSTLRDMGLTVTLLSGDRPEAVRAAAKAAGIEDFTASCLPTDKIARLEALEKQGRKVLMVGDGLNDAPSLAAAHASISPSSAADISQTAADFVFQGKRLGAVVTALLAARGARRLVLQNFGIAALYNTIAVPLAVAGLVTPLIAAVAMSASSIVVSLNALRLNLMKPGVR